MAVGVHITFDYVAWASCAAIALRGMEIELDYDWLVLWLVGAVLEEVDLGTNPFRTAVAIYDMFDL